MDALILIGGEGTRLKKVVNDRPKPMAEINGRPLLDILVEYISSYGFKRFILCTGYMTDYVKDYYNDKEHSFELVFSEEKTPLGTAGAIKNADKFIRSSPFLIINGDSFCHVDLANFVDFHIKKKSHLSIVVTEIQNARDFGSIVLDDLGRIVKFNEKMDGSGKLVSAGIYLFDRSILSAIPSGIKCSLENDIFPKLVGQCIYGFYTRERLIDIGTPKRYKQAKDFLETHSICKK
ncbi:MAG: hypothetical protein A3C43_04300 [Candidatus Schekmanbacteria bacterium RIFCSPHIGHO2_02_FULL_38_11]|uniref:Nucleotidyl transferase domain-containing protein n=1 Tax=Candidatus Schekmanbacteria bacterium RIFCSPLOWO2_12_FULL_38_15 TaxID=1817883 RepID=A0A1F7SJL0_9BACT|nr:MAG: hypothetical protein A2043_09565 [Candidatus Schekmanbacteria bacterium GWA2_38_9]OGL48253.1 MAG: hypothetical protein A3C43_04300 [Candidatus Schekmanbacteria bacterium RIFCSPHIGHO2_02_FULL_38_11]OGL50495.1 MAG: hypothetical protein A3H37_06225 [Candidatus Schekmanbacteria bacterium RIFCSPLOWO2_02_FULL_38_14]OGL53951.1 MAG: hypothetical protein A3G31_00740 [Candidatus Schekmanbacteria bacterium RIFCSPLOWO2_12_FULL_38_15]